MSRPTSVLPARLGLLAAIVLGITGILGAGVFTLIGVAAARTGPMLPLAFAIAGFAIAFSAYSYAKWSAACPDAGGPAEFIYLGYGRGGIAQALSLFQLAAYVLSTALQAAGFAAYATALTGWSPEWTARAVAAGIVVLFAIANILGLRAMLRGQAIILIVVAGALALFILAGVRHGMQLPADWQNPAGFAGLLAGSAILYVTFQGFAVVTNAAPAITNARRTIPRAIGAALALVAAVYILTSLVVVTVLPPVDVVDAGGRLLADAADVTAGTFGLITICTAALLATAAAVNAAIFSSARIGADLARHGALPRRAAEDSGRPPTATVVAVSAVVVLVVIIFPLTAIGPMVSLSFLALYAVINAGHLRQRRSTGARGALLVCAIAVNSVLFGFLLIDVVHRGPVGPWVALVVTMAGCLAVGFRVAARQQSVQSPSSGQAN